ncbi:MAG: helix-turn-helix transcriptional regulator [Bacteroides sp.]|nr:helix-turn-helix transcriptional regulator [Bacteroides sp.]
MSFSSKIKAIRQTCLLSQEAFAQELGVSFATVNRWESGKTRPTYKTLQLIRTFCIAHNIVFNISTTDLEDQSNA